MGDLESRYGETRGRVLEVMMPQEARTFVQRHEGFVQEMDKHDDVELVQSVRVDEASTSDVVQKLSPVLQRTEDIDAIYCPDFNTGLGATAALENVGMKAKRGEDGHVITSAIDASKTVLDQIKQGYIDSVVDQPNMFYGPITLEYIVKYLDAGKDESALPEMGAEISPDTLQIEGNNHLGVDVWGEPIWSPGDIRGLEFDDGTQRQFSTRAIVMRQGDDLLDAPYIWGNLSQKY
jgi:ABC-type sugar transport system substrate-binding protein